MERSTSFTPIGGPAAVPISNQVTGIVDGTFCHDDQCDYTKFFRLIKDVGNDADAISQTQNLIVRFCEARRIAMGMKDHKRISKRSVLF